MNSEIVAVEKFLDCCALNPLSADEKLIRAYIGVTVLGENDKKLVLRPLSKAFGLRAMAYATCGKLGKSTVLQEEKCNEYCREHQGKSIVAIE